ncbi:hypothetical protein [Pectobacterium carotovorum]|uniref:hypothetical protein n=1 Tax=Pectobacterium carotovorum TaxID=554 RepID=UPI003820DD6D
MLQQLCISIPFSSMDLLVKNFNVPIAIKRETQFEELLDNNELWIKILKETTIRKRDLSSQLKIEEIDKQHYISNEKSKTLELKELPDGILQYLKDNKLHPE